MQEKLAPKDPILVVGNTKLAFSITACLLQAGFPVSLNTQKGVSALACINTHFVDKKQLGEDVQNWGDLKILPALSANLSYSVAIAITQESLAEKKIILHELERVLSNKSIIAINSESLPLSGLQENAKYPERILGANWVEPAHTTYFLEIICNTACQAEVIDKFYDIAQKYWQKDPYIVCNDYGIRARMMAAMAREAFYLIENDYVGVEDIDRACRNDAGYYFPFAGNFRYMDLMGTYIYGIVMQDLNPELAKDQHLPQFFTKLIEAGAKGMENNQGFYSYQKGEVNRWEEQVRKFSYQIKQIIQKYPFNYHDELKPVPDKAYL